MNRSQSLREWAQFLRPDGQPAGIARLDLVLREQDATDLAALLRWAADQAEYVDETRDGMRFLPPMNQEWYLDLVADDEDRWEDVIDERVYEAKEKGESAGYERGVQEGYQEGYDDGLAEGEQRGKKEAE